jgi:hypothetical protein
VVYEVIFMHLLLSALPLAGAVAPASAARTIAQDLSVAHCDWWPQ